MMSIAPPPFPSPWKGEGWGGGRVPAKFTLIGTLSENEDRPVAHLYNVNNRAASGQANLGGFAALNIAGPKIIISPPADHWVYVQPRTQTVQGYVEFNAHPCIYSDGAGDCAIVGLAYRENESWVRAALAHVNGGNPESAGADWPAMVQRMNNRQNIYGVIACREKTLGSGAIAGILTGQLGIGAGRILVYNANKPGGGLTLGIMRSGDWGECAG